MTFFLRQFTSPTAGPAQDTGLRAELEIIEPRIAALGQDLLERARARRDGALSTRFWRERFLDWSMQDHRFKVQLFRFIDAFPTLQTPEQIHTHLSEYLAQPGVQMPAGLDMGLRASGLLKGGLARMVSQQVEAMAGRFIAGTNAASALPRLEELWDEGLAFSLDLLGEACVSDAEAEAYQQRYLELIRTLPEHTAGWPDRPVLEQDHIGRLPRTNVSIKISSLSARIKPEDFEGSIDRLIDRLAPILTEAGRQHVFINFDMEQHAYKELTLELFMRCCERFDFPAGIALQAYLTSGEDDARRLIAWSHRTGRQVTVRLIKGAYWDHEVIHAERLGWPVPVYTAKRATDACFERLAAIFIDQIPMDAGAGGVKLAVGSHNARSIAAALALIEHRNLPTSALELQMLHGMADALKAAVVEQGLRLREYVPVGEMIPGMAYLVRRLLENTSNESWLKAGFREKASPEALLASPHDGRGPDTAADTATDVVVPEARLPTRGTLPEPASTAAEQPPREQEARRHALSPAVEGLGDGGPFLSEPVRDFTVAEQRRAFTEAVATARVPEAANDTTPEQARQMVAHAHATFPGWRDADPLHRARCIVKAAALMRRQRDELAGIVIRESGKPWPEADADVCEAIDFCEYYARQAVALFHPERLGRFLGELDEYWYQPRGVAVVISPWNFPLAICTGMTVAALVTGNPTIVKPAEQTPGIARRLCELLWQAGVPRDVAHFAPGPGETTGAALVRDPRVAVIAFTGSKAVGLDIIEAAGHTPDDQPFVKRAVCEMGGKNAIIIDESADLDEAVLGVRQSAFSFAGQKCSACSRAIVVGSAREAFVRRLIESTRAMAVGDPTDPATDVGPVIDEDAATKIRQYIEIGRGEGELALAMDSPAGLAQRVGKPFIGPHIFTGIRPEHRLAQEEVFGPVLAVMAADSFDDALAIANSTSYRLTGGVFSRTPSHLAQARREFRVGNLYLNRGITGALVGRQPFGGFGLSGVGAKAGGPDYLRQFVDPRSACENTMRRGFSPEL